MLAIYPYKAETPSLWVTIGDLSAWAHGSIQPVIVHWNGLCERTDFYSQPRWLLFQRVAGMVLNANCYRAQLGRTDSGHLAQRKQYLDRLDVAVDALYERSWKGAWAAEERQNLKTGTAQARGLVDQLDGLRVLEHEILEMEVARVFGHANAPRSFADLYRCLARAADVHSQLTNWQASAFLTNQAGWPALAEEVRQDCLRTVGRIAGEWGELIVKRVLVRTLEEDCKFIRFTDTETLGGLSVKEVVTLFISHHRDTMMRRVAPWPVSVAQLKLLGERCRTMLPVLVEQKADIEKLALLCERHTRMPVIEAAMCEAIVQFMGEPCKDEMGLYRGILEHMPSEIKDDPLNTTLYKQRAYIWSTQYRKKQGIATIRSQELRNLFSRLMADVLQGIPTDQPPRQALVAHLEQALEGRHADPMVARELKAVLDYMEGLIEPLRQLRHAIPESDTPTFDIEDAHLGVNQLIAEFELRRRKLDIAAVEDLNSIYGHIHEDSADLTICVGSQKWHVHRFVMMRLDHKAPGLFSCLKYDKSDELKLDPAEGSGLGPEALLQMPVVNDVLAGCFLHFMYHGTIPQSFDAHEVPLTEMFRHIFADGRLKTWKDLPKPSPADWFEDHLLKFADTKIVCTDEDIPFYAGLLDSFDGLLAEHRDVRAARLSGGDVMALLHSVLGDLEHAEWGVDAFARFCRLDKCAAKLVGVELWEAKRADVMRACLGLCDADDLLYTCSMAQVQPGLRMVPACTKEMLKRLMSDVPLKGLCGKQRADIQRWSCAGVKGDDEQWNRISQFLQGCGHLRQLNLSDSNVSAHHVFEIMEACKDLSEVNLDGCLSMHPSIRSLARGEKPEALPSPLDPLCALLLERQAEQDPVYMRQVGQQLQERAQPLLTARALERLIACLPEQIRSLDLTDNPHVDADYLAMLQGACPRLQELHLPPEANMTGTSVLRRVNSFDDLALLEGAPDGVVRLLQETSHPNLNKDF